MKGIFQAFGAVFVLIMVFALLAKGGIIFRVDFNRIGATGHKMFQGAMDGADETPSSSFEFRYDPSMDAAE